MATADSEEKEAQGQRTAATPDSDEPTAADAANAPSSGTDVSGIDGGQESAPAALWLPRVALYPVRGILEIGMAPIRGLIFVDQKYQLRARIKELFFTEDKTFGIYPTALIETGFGLNVGARLVWKEMFGTDARLKLRAGYGGQFQTLFAGDITIPIGRRVNIIAGAMTEHRPRDRFFGLGMAESVAADELAMSGYDAVGDDVASSTRFSEDLARVGLRAELDLGGPFALGIESAYVHRTFAPAEDTPFSTGGATTSVDEVFDTATIPGFDDGVDYLYTELEVSMDTRRKGSRFASDPIPGTGWYFELYGGFAESVNNDITSFMRYGIDAQRYIKLAQNPRTLVLRAHVEGVTGDIDEVPFTELPRLGGPTLLRGFRRDRYRDRIRMLTTAEYQFDLSNMFAGFVFVDAGQVLRETGDAFSDFVVGYGGGLQLHTRTSYMGRLLVGTSTDGAFLFSVAFDPAFDIRDRTLVK